MDILSKAIELAETGNFESTHDIEHQLMEESYDFKEVRKFFDVPSNKKLLWGLIQDSKNK